MKIVKYGTVIFREGQAPDINGWLIEREPDIDPADATNEQLLLGFAIHWAEEQFKAAMKSTVMLTLRQMILDSLARKKVMAEQSKAVN